MNDNPQRDLRLKINRNYISFVTNSWLDKLISKGSKTPLHAEDLLRFQNDMTVDAGANVFAEFWKDYEFSRKIDGPRPLLSQFMAKMLKWQSFWYSLLYVCGDMMMPVRIILIHLLLKEVENSQSNRLNVLYYGLSLFVAENLQQTLNCAKENLLNSMQTRFNVQLSSQLFQKMFRLSNKAQSENQKVLLTIINDDTRAVVLIIGFWTQVATTTALIVFPLAALIYLLGWVGLVPLVVVVFTVFGNLLAANYSGPSYLVYKQNTDKRIAKLREFLYGIKAIKYQAIEQVCSSQIEKFRNAQLWALATIFKFMNIGLFFTILGLSLMPTVTVSVFYLNGGDLQGSTIFPALICIQMLLVPLGEISGLSIMYNRYRTSLPRVQQFLVADEQPENNECNPIRDQDVAIEFINCGCSYSQEPLRSSLQTSEITISESKLGSKFELRNLTVQIPRGALIGIVGKVGSGKSSLLNAIIGGMDISYGSKFVSGNVSFCSQQPWICTGTIRENIIFGSRCEDLELETIVRQSGLGQDIATMSDGLDTKIGENGINLSGGQKMRVTLARAAAQDSEIFLLDDPLASLDVHVGKQVFNDMIVGRLKGKTVLLVTHQLHLLPQFDKIIVVSDGTIAEHGTYEELMQNQKSVLNSLIKDWKAPELEDKSVESEIVGQSIVKNENANIQVEEERITGAVGYSDYKIMINYGGGYPALAHVSIWILVSTVCFVFVYIWLKFITTPVYERPFLMSTYDYLAVYVIASIVDAISASFVAVLITIFGYSVSEKYHRKALQSLVVAPLHFFESQPIGRIISRFSNDISSIDFDLVYGSVNIVRFFTIFLGSVITIAYSFPPMVAQFFVIALANYVLFHYFHHSYRELQRLNLLSSSPLNAHVSESIEGLAIIKAFKKSDIVIQKQGDLVEKSLMAPFLSRNASQWLSFRVGFLNSTITLSIILLGVFGIISNSDLGIAFVANGTLAYAIKEFFKECSHFESRLGAVERMNHYCLNLPREAPKELPSDPHPTRWPDSGKVELCNLTIAYKSRPNHNVVNNLCIKIRSGEKIGVVGRTAAGKSTLASAFFRILEPKSGTIFIDDIDYRSLGLGCLRRAISIIPQEPVLFEGSFRSNLDPDCSFDDDSIWHALQLVGLYAYVSSQAHKLESPISEGGSNLSQGQKQLLCLAKALLYDSKILILDEATASLDAESDQRMQAVIFKHMKFKTVISIAHRLQSVVQFDKILVLDKGQIVEFDCPRKLLANTQSVFAQMVYATGKSSADHIQRLLATKQP